MGVGVDYGGPRAAPRLLRLSAPLRVSHLATYRHDLHYLANLWLYVLFETCGGPSGCMSPPQPLTPAERDSLWIVPNTTLQVADTKDLSDYLAPRGCFALPTGYSGATWNYTIKRELIACAARELPHVDTILFTHHADPPLCGAIGKAADRVTVTCVGCTCCAKRRSDFSVELVALRGWQPLADACAMHPALRLGHNPGALRPLECRLRRTVGFHYLSRGKLVRWSSNK